MFCLAIEIMVKKTMEYHDFIFDNNLLRQVKGGSIGLSLTGGQNIYDALGQTIQAETHRNRYHTYGTQKIRG